MDPLVYYLTNYGDEDDDGDEAFQVFLVQVTAWVA